MTRLVGKYALCVNRYDDRKLFIFTANLKVVNTKAGGGMNATGTAFKRYVVADDNKRFSVKEGVLGGH